jgi:hypothetical protein
MAHVFACSVGACFFAPETLCTTYFGYGLRNGYAVGVSLSGDSATYFAMGQPQ